MDKLDRNEDGIGTIRALALMIALVLMTASISFVLKIHAVYQQAQTSLDMAVLSGANELISGFATTEDVSPCRVVGEVLEINGIKNFTCKVDKFDVIANANVAATVGRIGFNFTVKSKAGPQFKDSVVGP